MSDITIVKATVRGVGYLGVGEHEATVKGKRTPAYIVWEAMLLRCYSPKYQAKHPTYVGCTVHPDWHNFQVFAEWYSKQHRLKGWHLDKDLRAPNSHIYSEETCTFIPHELNTVLGACDSRRGELPQGVYQSGKKYVAQLSTGGKHHYLGTHNSAEVASELYRLAKEEYVRSLADQYRHQIHPQVYATLSRYEVTV